MHSCTSPHCAPAPSTLLATPAVLGAMTIAVPALAGISLRVPRHAPTAPPAASSPTSAKHRVRECLVRGARGLPGPAAPRGVHGPTGTNRQNRGHRRNGRSRRKGRHRGQPALTGHSWCSRTLARAYAVVQPTTPTQVNLIAGQTSDITGVSEPSRPASSCGIYCLAPAARINAAADTAAVSPEVSYSSGQAPGTIAVNAQRPHCPATDFEVDTYAPGTPRLTSGLRLHDRRSVIECWAARAQPVRPATAAIRGRGRLYEPQAR